MPSTISSRLFLSPFSLDSAPHLLHVAQWALSLVTSCPLVAKPKQPHRSHPLPWHRKSIWYCGQLFLIIFFLLYFCDMSSLVSSLLVQSPPQACLLSSPASFVSAVLSSCHFHFLTHNWLQLLPRFWEFPDYHPYIRSSPWTPDQKVQCSLDISVRIILSLSQPSNLQFSI